jgi:hypothetical protein
MMNVSYCPECYSRLSEYGSTAEEKFCEICEYFLIHNKPLKIDPNVYVPSYGILEIIKFLEFKRYVVSIEVEFNILLIKPLGIQCIRPNEEYCICHVCFDQEKHR